MGAQAPPPGTIFCPYSWLNLGFTYSGGGVMRASVRRLVAWTIAFAAALFASWPADIGASAWAQAPSDNLWTRPALSGDWGGLRSTLERSGVTFTFNYTISWRMSAVGSGVALSVLARFNRRSTSSQTATTVSVRSSRRMAGERR